LQNKSGANDPPQAGYEYILARVRIDYSKGKTADTTYRPPLGVCNDFVAVSLAGADYQWVCRFPPDPQQSPQLYPGASTEGWAVFYVAQNDQQPLMTFERNYDGTGGLWWKLY